MNEALYDILRSCTARLTPTKGGGHGTGVFVAPGLILTCAHVVESAWRHEIPIEVFWNNKKFASVVTGVLPGPYPDLAVLRIEHLEHPCVFLHEAVKPGDELYTFGYTDLYPNGDSATMECEGHTQLEDDGPVYGRQILLKLKGGEVRPGLSGSPLLNLRTGGVCGIIKTSRMRDTDLGGRAIPATVILSRFKEIGSSQRLFHQQNRLWLNSLTQPQLEEGHWHERSVVGSYPEQNIAVEKVKHSIEFQKSRIFTRFVSGSSRIKVENLLGSSCLLLPFRIKFRNNDIPTDKNFIETIIANVHRTSKLDLQQMRIQRYLLLADPGVGKTTLTYKLFGEIANAFLQDDTPCLPIHIDLREYVGDSAFGTKKWVLEFLDEMSTGHQLSWLGIREYDWAPTLVPFIILDSLDEFLSGSTTTEASRQLNCFIFQIANVITCRTQYFERYLPMSPFSDTFEKMYLRAWTDPDIFQYGEVYFKFCFPDENRSFARNIMERIDQAPQLKELCQVPLRLNMTLELLSDAESQLGAELDLDSINDLLSLYHAYLQSLLSREADRVGSTLNAQEKKEALEIVSWHFYDEGRIGENSSVRFTEVEMRKALQAAPTSLPNHELDTIAKDILERSILVVQTAQFSASEPTTIKFIHKSFQEYFVARYLFKCVNETPADTMSAFRRVISPEVSEFLKEYIKRVNVDRRLLDLVTTNCIAAYNLGTNQQDEQATLDAARTRIAKQQLAYYLGNLRSTKARDFLIDQMDRETDLWIKRGMIVGLSFGGYDEYLHQYIHRLRVSREPANDTAESEVNIGFHLSFFGDQPFDQLHPDKDQGLPACGNTLKKLIYQLGTETDRGSWRLNLHTILDLGKHRKVSTQNYNETLCANLDELKTVLSRLKTDPGCSWWPELAEVDELISKLEQESESMSC